MTGQTADGAPQQAAGTDLRRHAARALDLALEPLLDSAAAAVLLEQLEPLLGPVAPETGHQMREQLVATAAALLARPDPDADARRLAAHRSELAWVRRLIELLTLPEPERARVTVERAFGGHEVTDDALAGDVRAYADAPFELLADAHPLVRIAAVARRLTRAEPDAVVAGAELLGVSERALDLLFGEQGSAAVTPSELPPPVSAADLEHRVERFAEIRSALMLLADAADADAAMRRLESTAAVVLGAPVLPLWMASDDALVVGGASDLAGGQLSLRESASLAARAMSAGVLLRRDCSEPDTPVIDRQCARRLAEAGREPEAMELMAVPLLAPEPVAVLLMPAHVDEHDARSLAVHALRWLERLQSFERRLASATRNYRSAYERRLREIVHEANNPLSVIHNYLHLLGARLSDEDSSREQLRLIGDEIRRTGEILHTLVEVPTTVNGRTAEASRQADVNQVLTEVLELLEPALMDAAGIRTELRLAEGLGPIPADSQRLRQVVLNLLKNAVEAMPDGGTLEVAVDPEVVDGSGSRVEIRITDSGAGIEPDLLARLFDAGASEKGTGRGLGLSIVKRLVEELGGNILCRSRPGAGTSFIVLLPRE